MFQIWKKLSKLRNKTTKMEEDMATIINILYPRNYDIALITNNEITYYKEKGFLWFRWLKEITQ